MLTTCTLTDAAKGALLRDLGLPADLAVVAAEAEFKELPYFLVTRARVRHTHDPEKHGDINQVRIVDVRERGLLVDPTLPGTDGPPRLTLIPWSNVISLSLTKAE